MTRIALMICCLLFCVAPSDAAAGDVNLMVAGSLKDVARELSDIFTKKHPGIRIVNNQAASGTLAKQIENGAPADIFISANPKWMEYLKKKNMLSDKAVATFACNELAFIGKPELKAGSLQDLARLQRVAIGSPRSVPAGEYAMEAFGKAGIDGRLENRLVMARDVRECLMYAERGEVDGAVVYKTDALQLGKRTRILFVIPQHLYSRVTYPIAMTAIGSGKSDAVAFFQFLQSPKAKAVLAKYGFGIK